MSWANPEFLWLLLLLPLAAGVHIWRHYKKKHSSLLFSDISKLHNIPGNWKRYGVWVAPACKWIAFALIVMAMARPQYKNTTVTRNAEGIDIVLSLDISTSMKAEDLKPNRFEAARDVAVDFINKRISDRIGLVVFARKSFTVVPPTLDYRLLEQLLNDVQMGIVEDGTAIGMGIATAVNRLKESRAESKVIILLTDGQNNSGEIDPVTAADLAVTYGIKIYTIGAGTRGTAPYPVQDPIFGKRYQNVKVDIDEEMLKKIARMTGGAYFRATDTQKLQDIYNRIDQLEKTKIEEQIFTDYQDLYPRFLIPSFILLVFSVIADKVLFRTELA